jgi:hypothetical protein
MTEFVINAATLRNTRGNATASPLEYADLVVDATMRWVVDAAVGAARSVGCEDAVNRGDYVAR